MFGYASWWSNVFGCGTGWCSYWWWALCLVVMMLMMGLCFLFMTYMIRRRKGNMTCCLPLFRKGGGTNYAAPDSARDILDRRYASGEISAEEYEERKKNLNQTQDTKGGI